MSDMEGGTVWPNILVVVGPEHVRRYRGGEVAAELLLVCAVDVHVRVR